MCRPFARPRHNFFVFFRENIIYHASDGVERDKEKREALNAISDHHLFYSAGVCAIQILDEDISGVGVKRERIY